MPLNRPGDHPLTQPRPTWTEWRTMHAEPTEPLPFSWIDLLRRGDHRDTRFECESANYLQMASMGLRPIGLRPIDLPENYVPAGIRVEGCLDDSIAWGVAWR